MPESTLAKKLKLKPGLKAAIIHAPENYLDELRHDAGLSATLKGKFDQEQGEARCTRPKSLQGTTPRIDTLDLLPQGKLRNPDRPEARSGLVERAAARSEMDQPCLGQRDLVRLWDKALSGRPGAPVVSLGEGTTVCSQHEPGSSGRPVPQSPRPHHLHVSVHPRRPVCR